MILPRTRELLPKEKTREMIRIADDGTMDTVVAYEGTLVDEFEVRYSSEFRFSFDSDEQFLDEIADEIADQVIEEQLLRYLTF